MAAANRGRAGCRGFTLIELLVVVAIIAVLISILLPSMKNARSQARKILCMNRLKAQGEVMMMYAHENEDTIMRGIYPDGRPGEGQSEWGTFFTSLLRYLHYDGPMENRNGIGIWRIDEMIEEVLSSVPQYQCPSFPFENSPLDYCASAMAIPYTRLNEQRDFATGPPGDLWIGEGGMEWPHYIGRERLSKLDRYSPGRLILVTEAHASLADDYRNGGSPYTVRFHHWFYTSQLPFGHRPRMANDDRHMSQVNAMFFDGHATSMSYREMDPGWPKDRYVRLSRFTVTADPNGP